MVIKFSWWYCVALLLLHMLAAAVVYVTALPLSARLALLLLIFLSLLYYLARDAYLLMPDSWCEISLVQDGVALVTRDGSIFIGQLVTGTTVSSYFVVLRLKLHNRYRPVSRVIFPDALNVDEFRAFCVRLKFT